MLSQVWSGRNDAHAFIAMGLKLLLEVVLFCRGLGLPEEVVASAPGKVILLGEHFVVYGVPAIVAAIELRARASVSMRADSSVRVEAPDLGLSGLFRPGASEVEGDEGAEEALRPIFLAVDEVRKRLGRRRGLNISISSSIPIAAGLGSSAAVAVSASAATCALLKGLIDKELVFRAALEAEKLVHVSPSGVDPAISTHGGLIIYKRGVGIQKLEIEAPLELVVGDTGLKRSTGALVSAVRALRNRRPELFQRLLSAAEELISEALDALRRGDALALGELMDINQGLLSAIGVSNLALEKLVHAARKAGALGAKLTGAGGGGCMIALVEEGLSLIHI